MAEPNSSLGQSMRLRVHLPTCVLFETHVVKVNAEAENGAFCLLPRHIDFVAALKPGILSFVDTRGVENFAALDRGVLVKCDRDVWVAAFDGVHGTDLQGLSTLVEEKYLELDEREQKTRTALARLELGAQRGFFRLQEELRG